MILANKYALWLAGLASLLVLSLSAQAAFPIPGSAVPVTLQSLVVVLIPVLMGGRGGVVVLLGYLLLGGFGLPVFAGGAYGWEKLTGPSAGFLVGFVLAAPVVGLLVQRGWAGTFAKRVVLIFAGHLVLYIAGMLWLYTLQQDIALLTQTMVRLLPGLGLKVLLGAGLAQYVWRLSQKLRNG